MNFVFYDLETTGRNSTWDQIIQVGAILVDENFNEIERFEERCRLRPGVVPEPGALIVNNTSIEMLNTVNTNDISSATHPGTQYDIVSRICLLFCSCYSLFKQIVHLQDISMKKNKRSKLTNKYTISNTKKNTCKAAQGTFSKTLAWHKTVQG